MCFYVSAPKQINNSWDVLDYYVRGYKSVMKIIEIVRKNTDDPTMLSQLDNLQEILKGKKISDDGDI